VTGLSGAQNEKYLVKVAGSELINTIEFMSIDQI
jgi:hypothetical protein